MIQKRKLSRRSFLARVVGGAVVAGGLLAEPRQGRAHQVTDRDPYDPVGRGRGGGTGITDSDAGAGSDPAGRGRGGGTGITDRDSGAYADPVGRGRGGGGGGGMSAEERTASCDRLRQLEAQIRADMAQQGGVNTRSLAELRRVQTALIQHCS